jgi:hypothetical protein
LFSGRAVSSDRDFVQSEKCVETLLRDALMGDASAGPCASAGCPMSERALELMMQQLLKSMGSHFCGWHSMLNFFLSFVL